MSRGDPQFRLRMPQAIHDAIKLQAAENGRTMNAEIVEILKEAQRAGMSLRDHFAGQALCGMWANSTLDARADDVHVKLASLAYFAADTMLAERAKGSAS